MAAAACSRADVASGSRDVGQGDAAGNVGPGAVASASESPSPTESAATSVLRSFARDGMDAADRLGVACDDRPAYLALRRSAAALMATWRRWMSIAAETVFGPEVAIDEQGGSLGALDRALDAADCAAVKDGAGVLSRVFRVTDSELERRGIDDARVVQALSDCAYACGQAIVEATPFVPSGDDAALADAAGLVDFLEGGAAALGFAPGVELPSLGVLHRAANLGEVRDRAVLARATGRLGAALRRQAKMRGLETLPRYRPATPTDDIGVLTLPRPAAPSPPLQAALGARLFSDPRLSRGRARSCATCHVPARAFADGQAAPRSLDPATPLRRNTPSLLYAPLAARLTWDGRVRTADRQALMVIHTRAEMGQKDDGLTAAVASEAATRADFRRAFGRDVTAADVGFALAAFEARDLVPDRAPLDLFARGDDAALSADARAGFDVFAGKGRCARCHVPPVFGGSRPPDFTAPIFAVLGVPAAPIGPGARAVDADRGRGDGAFKVPTVRDVDRTAPYFHNGGYATLDEVVDFYDRGAGRGLGLDVPAQDPEVRPLGLGAEDKRVLLVFLREGLADPR